MPVEICCPNCARKYIVTAEHIGRKVVCADTACGTRFIATIEQSLEDQSDTLLQLEATDNTVVVKNFEPIFANQRTVTSAELVNDQPDLGTAFSQGQNPETTFTEVTNLELDGAQGQVSNLDVALEPSGRTPKPFWGIAKKVLTDASAHVSSKSVAATSKAVSLGSSGVAKATEIGKQTFVAANSAIDSSGAKEAIKATASVVSGKLDEVSGKRLVELLEKKLRIQDSYNDILATRLAEALDRIKTL
jgi:hypothetical protein